MNDLAWVAAFAAMTVGPEQKIGLARGRDAAGKTDH